jgi:hypothetical protein
LRINPTLRSTPLIEFIYSDLSVIEARDVVASGSPKKHLIPHVEQRHKLAFGVRIAIMNGLT